MRWRSEARLTETIASLRAHPSPASRGAGLERLLAEIFGREHFRVETDFIADGRQIDLFVIRGDLRLLVEAKWTKRRSQHGVVDEMRARLETASPGVVGLVVSMSGFSPAVIERVERSADRPILLMDGRELEQVLTTGGGLHSLIRYKLDHLYRNRTVVVGRPARETQGWMDELPESELRIIDRKGYEHPYWTSNGEYAETVSTPVLLDLDSAREGGVRLDMRLAIEDSDGLVRLLKKLAQFGWISPEGAWRIEQSATVWSGMGPAEFARQLTDWESRYADRPAHHHEVAMYVDTCDDGMLTLNADISASQSRFVRWCELSFVLPGVPLDPTPYEALTAEIPVLNTPIFNVISRDPVQSGRPRLRGRPRSLHPLAYLVRDSSRFENERHRWVEGLISKDPLPRSSPSTRIDNALPVPNLGSVLVRLRQHHQLGDPVDYHLLGITAVQTGYVNLLNVTGDWAWPGDKLRS